ncbi:MAG: BBP7 family outer membrane beta-barrel protein [Gemmataceae bacterium]
MYANVDYLLWWLKPGNVPPLLTTSPIGSTAVGRLGEPDTTILFGNSAIGRNPFSGGRFSAGLWLDHCRTFALEGGYFVLGQRAQQFFTDSNAVPNLYRPFYDANLDLQNSQTIATPNRADGSFSVSYSTEMWGAEANGRLNLCRDCWYRIDGIAGFRYVQLDDKLHIGERVVVSPATIEPRSGSTIVAIDQFDTRNRFYGGQLGVLAECRHGNWVFDMRLKVALGETQQYIDIVGNQVETTATGQVQRFTGGLLALSSNVGRHRRNEFSVIPELGIHIGYQFTPNIRANMGYTFLYWSSVVRPGDQIDLTLDSNLIPVFNPPNVPPVFPSRPIVPFKRTDFWAQGLNFGLEFTW